LDKYFLLYSHYIFWNVMVLLLEYVFSVLFPPLVATWWLSQEPVNQMDSLFLTR